MVQAGWPWHDNKGSGHFCQRTCGLKYFRAGIPAITTVEVLAATKTGYRTVQKKQSDLRLRTACQIFSTTFRLHKNLCSSLIFGSDSQSCQLPSLVKWLCCYHSHVKRLQLSHGIPWLETALVALHSPHSCLEVVHNYNTVPDTATFQSINTCTLHSNQSIRTYTLHSSQTDSVNLRPLSSLPLLTRLTLRKVYECLICPLVAFPLQKCVCMLVSQISDSLLICPFSNSWE